MSAPARLRMSRTALLPVVILLVCAVPLVAATPWALPVLLVPLVLALWVRRVGVDVDDDGITVRSLLAERHARWSELAGIRVADRGALRLVTTARTEVRLPVLRARDLPRLAALSDGRIRVPEPTA